MNRHFQLTKPTTLLVLSLFASLGSTQKIGTLYAETHPPLTWSQCTPTCATQAAKVVLDVGKRPIHTSSGLPCRLSDRWDQSVCPPNNSPLCTSACYVDGAAYSSSYGVTTSGNQIRLKYVTSGSGNSVGSRVYLMDTTDTKYQTFKLLNKEFAFDVDASMLPCGLKGSLYFVAMDEDGGKAQWGTGVAGPKYGTGYCDAKCAKTTIYINGEANPVDSQYPEEIGLEYGSCCAEIDLWNANSISTQLSVLPCLNAQDQVKCHQDQCQSGFSTCDPDGCDFNPYRMGATNFYGPGKSVNSNSKITVVTQFITDDGTDNGNLSQIKRIYVQNGVTIANANVNIPGLPTTNVVTDSFCTNQKAIFGDYDKFSELGGLAHISNAMRNGMVLTMSIADDPESNMLWLDSNYPLDSDPSAPGIARGTCSTVSGYPPDVQANSPNAYVIFENIRFGGIDKTGAIPGTVTPPVTPPVTPQPACPEGGQANYGQCGGRGWTGLTTCCPPHFCYYLNEWYSQCIPDDWPGLQKN